MMVARCRSCDNAWKQNDRRFMQQPEIRALIATDDRTKIKFLFIFAKYVKYKYTPNTNTSCGSQIRLCRNKVSLNISKTASTSGCML